MLAELSHAKGRAITPGAGTSPEFEVHLGGQQGGTRTPRLWNTLIATIMEPLLESWRERKLGYTFTGPDLQNSHVVWAENMFLWGNSFGIK